MQNEDTKPRPAGHWLEDIEANEHVPLNTQQWCGGASIDCPIHTHLTS